MLHHKNQSFRIGSFFVYMGLEGQARIKKHMLYDKKHPNFFFLRKAFGCFLSRKELSIKP